MALQKELIALVSEGIGVAPETVTIMDRQLLEAGMRTRSLRGRAKTPMTYRDAANLIIAAAWNRSPSDTVRLVADYRDLKAAKKNPLGETFGEAVESVLSHAAQYSEDFKAHPRAVTITLIGPVPYAIIEVQRYAEAEVDENAGLIGFGPWEGQINEQPVVRRVDLRASAYLAIAESIADGLRDA